MRDEGGAWLSSPERATDELIESLSRPGAYAHRPAEVEFLQTHISLLFFAGERVYKVKKPVELGFLDFSTLERRLHYCREELRLNRRMARRVYLGVVPIVRSADGSLVVGGDGEPVEWAVEMVRLPADRMLDHLLAAGEVDNQEMNDLAQLLASFHDAAARNVEVDAHGAPAAVARIVRENFDQLEPFVGEGAGGSAVMSTRLHDFLSETAERFLDAHHDLFERRVRDGRIREGHGDLHAGNLCLTDDGPVAYDCLEFAPRYRCADVACDLAFLAMDLDYRGFAGFARYLVHRYGEVAGDREIAQLIDFYKSYRAVVRGKVAALTSADVGVPPEERCEKRREARRYLQLAAGYDLAPALILTCGLPGCGKSWTGRHLAGPFRAAVLQSDVRRKVLAGIPPKEHRRSHWAAGPYTPEMTERTYASLLERAAEVLESGRSVIVDAAFAERNRRAAFLDLADRLGLAAFVVHVTADEELIRERLERRATTAGEVSDADFDVYRAMRERFQPPDEIPDERVVVVRSGEDEPEESSALLIDAAIGPGR